MKRAIFSAALTVAALWALGVSQAGGDPTARSAAANTLVASIANTTPPDEVGRKTIVTITGQILASRKFAPRHCRAARTVLFNSVSVGGRTNKNGRGATTNTAGRFSSSFEIDYGFTDSEGLLHDGDVPESGGTFIVPLAISKTKVQRAPGAFQTYTCRPLSAQVQIAVPPQR